MAERADLDVILGGGSADFLPEAARGQRRDGRDLLQDMIRRGYTLPAGGNALQISQPWRSPKLLGFFGADTLQAPGSPARNRARAAARPRFPK